MMTDTITKVTTNTASRMPKAAFSTARANIRAGEKESSLLTHQRREAQPKKEPAVAFLAIRPPDLSRNPFFDSRLPTTFSGHSHRPKQFVFQEKGKFVAEAERERAEIELEQLRREVGETLGKVEELDAEIVADLLQADPIPEIDWWDSPFLNDQLDGSSKLTAEPRIDIITNLIQRPALLPPPVDVDTLITPKPLMLTTEEMKKMRRQRRLAEHREKQEQIRLGLKEPDAPKVRIANIARVLGTQSVQEPSKVEAEIRSQLHARQQAHQIANAERKEQAKEAAQERNRVKRQQMSEDINVPTAIFRIKQLAAPQWRFKVTRNAQQQHLTGCIIYYEGFSFILVEGASTAIRHYKHLLLERINWRVAPDGWVGNVDDNNCSLLWEGTVKQRVFSRLEVKSVNNEIDAREYLATLGLEHYWRLAKQSM
jgi:U4/U6 small nuclear ribonucleoprotein PRP3